MTRPGDTQTLVYDSEDMNVHIPLCKPTVHVLENARK